MGAYSFGQRLHMLRAKQILVPYSFVFPRIITERSNVWIRHLFVSSKSSKLSLLGTDNYNINIYNLFDADILRDIIPSEESAVGKPFKCSL